MTRPIHFQRPDQRVMELLPWSEDDLVALSTVSEEDIQRARQYWADLLPQRWRGLLDAEPA